MSSELDLNNSIFHHPSLDSSSSSFADATRHDSMELMLRYQQKHAKLEQMPHLNDEDQHSKIACSTSLLDGRLVKGDSRLFIQES